MTLCPKSKSTMLTSRNKTCAFLISCIDMGFGLSLVGLYSYEAIVMNESTNPKLQELDNSSYIRIISLIALLCLVAVNCMQVLLAGKVAGRLLHKDLEISRILDIVNMWFNLSKPLYVFFTIKLMFIVVAVRNEQGDLFIDLLYILTPVEWVFKLGAFYKMNLFSKDLQLAIDGNNSVGSVTSVTSVTTSASVSSNCYSITMPEETKEQTPHHSKPTTKSIPI